MNQTGNTVLNVALNPADDNWVIIYDTNRWKTSAGIPTALTNELTRLTTIGATIKGVALGASDRWLVLYGTNSFTANNIPTAMYTSLTNLQSAGQNIKAAAFGPSTSTWVILFGQNSSYAASIPTALYNQLRSIGSTATLNSVALGASDSWVLTANTNDHWYSGVPTGMSGAIDAIVDYNYTITSVALGLSGSYVVTYGSNGWYATATRSVGIKHDAPHR